MNGSRVIDQPWGYQASSQIRFYKRLDRITALLTMHNALAVRAPFEGNNSEAAYLGVVESLHHTCMYTAQWRRLYIAAIEHPFTFSTRLRNVPFY